MDTQMLCSTSTPPSNPSNFFYGAKFSPDGLCLLSSTTADTTLRLYEPSSKTPFNPLLTSHEASTIYSYEWYPLMDSSIPASCVYLSSARNQPLHLWDAYTGGMRASYRAYDQNDEITSANSVTFSLAGDKIYAGYVNEVKVFRTDLPGRTCQTLKTVSTKKRQDGQKGIMSALACSQSLDQVWACGSYAGTIYLYDDRQSGAVADFEESSERTLSGLKVNSAANRSRKRNFGEAGGLGGGGGGGGKGGGDGGVGGDGEMNIEEMMARVKSQWYEKNVNGGVTDLKWGENILFSSSRRGDGVVCWDMR